MFPSTDTAAAGRPGSPVGETDGAQAPDSFVPTVTAISSAPDLQWMVQPALIPPETESPCPGRAEAAEPPRSSRAKSAARKSKGEQLSPEEEEKKRIRRERNKMAAAKCRNRRRELTDTLQAETDKLEEDKAALQAEIESLLKEKERLEYVLAAHKPLCPVPEELDGLFPESPPPLPAPESSSRAPEDLDLPGVPSGAISGNSDLLLCSSAELGLSELEPSLDELERGEAQAARSVPDIDLSGSLGASDWETLYRSVASDLEPLSTPVVSSCLSVFSFACPELDSLADGPDACRGRAEPAVDILNSPTLLAL